MIKLKTRFSMGDKCYAVASRFPEVVCPTCKNKELSNDRQFTVVEAIVNRVDAFYQMRAGDKKAYVNDSYGLIYKEGKKTIHSIEGGDIVFKTRKEAEKYAEKRRREWADHIKKNK